MTAQYATRFAGAVDRLHERTGCARLLIAFSGGIDSSVLLDLASNYAAARAIAIEAIHVDHGLEAASPTWATHCASVCAAYAVPYRTVAVPTRPRKGVSIEAWAREQRYSAFAAGMDRATCLLTAHHGDDQAETVLHHVLRGSGPHGLGAIRFVQAFADGWLGRPLLGWARVEVATYAREHNLSWIEDPSNENERLTRNYLRRRVLPQIETRFPAAARGLQRMARLQQKLAAFIDEQTAGILRQSDSPDHVLEIELLESCVTALRPYLIRAWLERAGYTRPGQRHIGQILASVVDAAADRTPCMRWEACEVRRYRGRLYAMRQTPRPDPFKHIDWDPRAVLRLPWGCLAMRVAPAGRLDPELAAVRLSVKFRRGGERFRLAGSQHRTQLKKLFQQWGVPPWERDLTPLILHQQEIVAVGALGVADAYAVPRGAPGLALTWTPQIYVPAEASAER